MTEKSAQGEGQANMDMVVAGDEKVEAPKTKGNAMDVGPGILSMDLPCGYIDEDGILHDKIVVGEMTGYEEDILAGKGPVVPRLNQIIANCTKRFGDLTDKKDINEAVTNMTSVDRMVALIAIRRVSLGDFYDVKIQCPDRECKAQNRFSLDLSEIDIVRMKDQKARVREDVLDSGRRVKWHVMSAEDESWLSKHGKRKEDMLTLAMLSRIDAVDVAGEDGVLGLYVIDRSTRDGHRNAIAALKSIGIRDRNFIRRLFEKFEGSVDTEVEFVCPSCGHEWSADLDVGQAGFFFPSGT